MSTFDVWRDHTCSAHTCSIKKQIGGSCVLAPVRASPCPRGGDRLQVAAEVALKLLVRVRVRARVRVTVRVGVRVTVRVGVRVRVWVWVMVRVGVWAPARPWRAAARTREGPPCWRPPDSACPCATPGRPPAAGPGSPG